MKNTTILKDIIFVIIATLISLGILCVYYPEYFISYTRGFMYSHDPANPYENVFNLLTQFFHGGVQLFDRYDQFNYAYSYLASGFYTLANFMVCIIYIVASVFMFDSAKTFHDIHSIVFYGGTVLIRCMGGYLLLRLFTQSRFVILVSLVLFNTLLSSQMFNSGLFTNNLYSYLPLFMFFILRFFEHFRLMDLLGLALIFSIAVANFPLFTLAYFYPVVHMFLLMCIIGAVGSKLARRRFLEAIKSVRVCHWWKIAMCVIVCGLIVAPSIGMFDILQKDFYVTASGLGATRGRINNAFQPDKYFQVDGKSFANPLEFVSSSLDYQHFVWGEGMWVFIGASIFGLCLFGLFLSNDRRRHVIWLTMFIIVLLNIAPYRNNLWAFWWYVRDTLAHPQLEQAYLSILMMLSSMVHWVNVLTNPFSFLMRSFHMSALLSPYLLLPLIALGLIAGKEIVQGRFSRRKILFALIVMGIVIALGLFVLEGTIRVYALITGILFLLFLYVFLPRNGLPRVATNFIRHRGVWIGGAFLFIILLIDARFLSVYVHDENFQMCIIKPRILKDLPASGNLIVDYQNPRVLPLREFCRGTPIGGSLYTYTNMYGNFYQFNALERYLLPPDFYRPLGMVYKGMDQDSNARQYIENDCRMFVFSSAGGLLDRSLSVEQQQWRTYQFNINQARVKTVSVGIEYAFKLPVNFPSYLSTTVFTRDYDSWQLKVGKNNLTPVQGAVVEPLTFDVNNVRLGWLVFVLSKDQSELVDDIQLRLKMPENISDVWRNEHDRLGMTYQAPRDGWLLIHYPYDPKWRLTIDGQPTTLQKANNFFMAMPLTQGSHKILLEYWPQSPWRILIVVSMILGIVMFFVLIGYGLRVVNDKEITR